MNSQILSDITFCTYSTGDLLVREVLGDWIKFLGGKPKQVIFSVSPAANPPPIYAELHNEGIVDQVIYFEPNDRSIYEIDLEAIRAAVGAAETEWVLLAKLDTLPFRQGNESWLSEAIDAAQNSNCLGLTGSGLMYYDVHPAPGSYSKVQKFSNNFSIIRKKDWLALLRILM